MASITFNKFDVGLDLRKGSSVSDANRLRELKNAYVTTGKVIRKRPGIQLVATFTGAEAGTVGLIGAGGKLHTFTEGAPAGHVDSLFQMNRVAHPTLAQDLVQIDDGDIFSGYIYTSAVYADGSRHHHYLDGAEDPVYDATRSYLETDYVSGDANDTNGLRWKCTTESTTIALSSSTAVSNTVITTASLHGFSAGETVEITGVTDGTFDQAEISKIGKGAQAKVETVAAHGYSAGDTVILSDITTGVFDTEINGRHVIYQVISPTTFTIFVVCTSSAGSGGFVGFTDINRDWYIVATPTTSSFTIGQKCSLTLGTGNIYISAGSEPAWGTTVGAVVTAGDGTTQFTAESTYIADEACPNTASFTKAASKIWAIDDDVVRACSVNSPRVWDATLTNLPGVILPVSTHAKGSSTTTAIAQYDGRLAVFFIDGIQFWDVDPNPAQDSYYKSVEGVGTHFPRTPREFSGDIIFLAESGLRSVTTLQYASDNLAESDVGSAIDKLVKPNIDLLTTPKSEFYLSAGQYWCAMCGAPDEPVFALTYSRTQKISAWAEYDFSFPIEYMATRGGKLYLRSGEDVYRVNSDDTVFDDNGTPFEMRVEMPFLDFKKPGSTKSIYSMDVVLQGSCDVQFRFDPNNPSHITDKIRLTGDTRQTMSIPLEVTCASISPVFTDTSSDDLEIEAITFHYDELGPV